MKFLGGFQFFWGVSTISGGCLPDPGGFEPPKPPRKIRPWGTVLGPILFIIYINDIIDHVSHSTIRCFADDTRVCKSIADCSNILELQRDLDSIILWSSRNNMALHEDKFENICHNTVIHQAIIDPKSSVMKFCSFICYLS